MQELSADSIDPLAAASKRLELAKLLATGFLRLRLQQLAHESEAGDEKSVESEQHSLESL